MLYLQFLTNIATYLIIILKNDTHYNYPFKYLIFFHLHSNPFTSKKSNTWSCVFYFILNIVILKNNDKNRVGENLLSKIGW